MTDPISHELSLPALAAVARACAAVDGTDPIDEYGYLVLRHHPEQVTTAQTPHGLALAYAGQVALAVAPEHRGSGLGRQLLGDLLGRVDAGPLEAWSHGHHPAAAHLAEEFGFTAVRDLWVMRRPISGPSAPPLPPVPTVDWILRSYRPGDAEQLLALNAAAFVDHPEQGAMDADNLAERMAQDWYDPADLLVGEDPASGAMLGFHWTKRHSPTEGEVYVVGVDPAAQGRGLGKVLTLAGLHHLAATGTTDVHLYVESDNAPAVAVYTKLGFTHAPADTHVMYARP